MEAEQRRQEMLERLKTSTEPIVARSLAETYDVSRQVIVGDVALLRAAGEDIYSTPKGYVMRTKAVSGLTTQIVCSHTREQTKEELYTIVDSGSEVLDVIVEHPVYGTIKGDLNISSRLEVDEFIDKLKQAKTSLLSKLTDGIHTHTIRSKNEAGRDKLIELLREKGFLYE
ncbi:MAG: transcription repressor NadR [Alkalibacterium sp.]|uniref:transcription repressor NadR n=1 Tax=Alkalibacterium TaxID=99906 RepID=UPI002649672E|nr:transcription repressor NadR [Alkalibacterium sp.]MDN6294116.1 transcription repressor NadR [Alkalibacterium sp.]MDN6295714.1 transcription repressor NadR [Alkalibacterium sp.]MDN6326631.1 transcription repressor NadR [Alkalibacterium sp.]MDN6397872.1 transcription repressor NadR [Alkalibacterium sp.]